MFSLTESHRFFLCQHYVDMRKGIDSLCSVVRSNMITRSCHASKCFTYLSPPFSRLILRFFDLLSKEIS